MAQSLKNWTSAHSLLIGSLVTLTILTSFLAFGAQVADGLLHIYFLNVGQGDAILIKTPSGNHVLIDGGPGNSVMHELANLLPINERTLDAVLVTHTDADHLAGLVPATDYYEVDMIIETGMVCATAICRRWETVKNNEHAQHVIAQSNKSLDLGDGIRLEIIYPFRNEEGLTFKKTNDGGIVTRLTYGTQSVMFMADVSQEIERRLLGSSAILDSDFLKVGHHGSKYSSTKSFLDAVSPLAAFIEVGSRNTYGHPAPETLKRLESLKIPYYRTDAQGRIELILNGQTYSINTQQ